MECILALSKKKKVCGMPSYLLPFFFLLLLFYLWRKRRGQMPVVFRRERMHSEARGISTFPAGGLGCLLLNTLFFYSDLGYESPLLPPSLLSSSAKERSRFLCLRAFIQLFSSSWIHSYLWLWADLSIFSSTFSSVCTLSIHLFDQFFCSFLFLREGCFSVLWVPC
jgi:hypothetical protein